LLREELRLHGAHFAVSARKSAGSYLMAFGVGFAQRKRAP